MKSKQSIDQLTKEEMKVYEDWKKLRKDVKALKIVSGAALLLDFIYVTGSVYWAMNSPDYKLDHSYAPVADGVMTGLITFGYGLIKKFQGTKEANMKVLEQKEEYKRAERFMDKVYEK